MSLDIEYYIFYIFELCIYFNRLYIYILYVYIEINVQSKIQKDLQYIVGERRE